MKRRLESLFRPDPTEPLDAPTLGEAFAVWLLGVLGALTCLWLAFLGSHWVLPGVLVGGLFALWGWRHAEWLWWFPSAVVVASAAEAVSPLAARARFGALLYADVLALGVVVVGLVRAIALDRPLLPHTPTDRAMAALLGLYALTLMLPGAGADALLDARDAVTTGVVFYATVAIASWPGGARWAWLAFPMAAGLAGLHITWAAIRDPGALDLVLGRADVAWRTTGGLWASLLVSLPLGFGLAINAGQIPFRHVWTAAWTLGAVGAVVLFASAGGPFAGMPASPANLADTVRTVLLAVALAGLAILADGNRRRRPHESPRWLAAAFTLGTCALCLVGGVSLGGPARLLLAVAAGLVIGTLRADARTVASFAPRARERATDRPQPAPAHAGLLSVVIVAYRSRTALEPCLASLAAARARMTMEAIVVDNDSRDGTLEWIRREHPWVETIASPTNVGFARGVNLGMSRARGDRCLVLNPDCEVNAEALETLSVAGLNAPDVAACAPMLLHGDGQPARSCGRFPNLWTLVCDHLGLAQMFPRSRWFGGYKYGERALETLDRVDWASGACLLIPRSAWDRLGALDERIFMYMEEVDWCRRAAGAGLAVRFVPQARITHHGQMSSKQVPGETYQHNLRSRVYYFRKHHGWLAAAAAKGILVVSLTLKWGVSLLRATSRPLAVVYARGVNTVWMA